MTAPHGSRASRRGGPRTLPGGWVLPEDLPARGTVVAPAAAGSFPAPRPRGDREVPVRLPSPRTGSLALWVVPPPAAPRTLAAPVALRSPASTFPTGTLPAGTVPTSALPVAVDDDCATLPVVGGGTRALLDPLPAAVAVARPRRQWRRPALIGSVAAVMAAVTAAGPTFGDESRTVRLSVDGQVRTVAIAGDRVDDVLQAAGLQAGPRDLVAPAPGSEVADGGEVTVRRARQVTLEVEGSARTWWTTATTVDQALTEMGVRTADYQLSASRSRAIGVGGTTIVGRPLHTVTIVDGTGRPVRVRLAAETVGQVLADRGITVRAGDRVSPASGTPVSQGLRISVTRVDTSRRTVDRAIPQPQAVERPSADVGIGDTRTVQPGAPGVRRLTVLRTVTNGVPAEKVVGDVVVRPATPRIVETGTKETGLPESWNVPWDKMAFCESTDRWDVNTGNGTYGGLQFMTPTWLEYGGGQFAPRADLATKEQQIIVAERLYAKEGLAPWHCARLLGWGFGKYTG